MIFVSFRMFVHSLDMQRGVSEKFKLLKLFFDFIFLLKYWIPIKHNGIKIQIQLEDT